MPLPAGLCGGSVHSEAIALEFGHEGPTVSEAMAVVEDLSGGDPRRNRDGSWKLGFGPTGAGIGNGSEESAEVLAGCSFSDDPHNVRELRLAEVDVKADHEPGPPILATSPPWSKRPSADDAGTAPLFAESFMRGYDSIGSSGRPEAVFVGSVPEGRPGEFDSPTSSAWGLDDYDVASHEVGACDVSETDGRGVLVVADSLGANDGSSRAVSTTSSSRTNGCSGSPRTSPLAPFGAQLVASATEPALAKVDAGARSSEIEKSGSGGADEGLVLDSGSEIAEDEVGLSSVDEAELSSEAAALLERAASVLNDEARQDGEDGLSTRMRSLRDTNTLTPGAERLKAAALVAAAHPAWARVHAASAAAAANFSAALPPSQQQAAWEAFQGAVEGPLEEIIEELNEDVGEFVLLLSLDPEKLGIEDEAVLQVSCWLFTLIECGGSSRLVIWSKRPYPKSLLLSQSKRLWAIRRGSLGAHLEDAR